MKHPALIATAALLLAIAPASVALADESNDMQARIDAVLETHPGGTQIAPNEVSWEGGDIVLTLAADGTTGVTPLAAVGNCASGSFCAYTLAGCTQLSGVRAWNSSATLP